MTTVNGVLDDLDAEGAGLEALLRGLAEPDWALATPAAGWTIAHQVAHLAWSDDLGVLAATEPDRFADTARGFAADPTVAVSAGADHGPATPPHELLGRWCAGRDRLADTLRRVPSGVRLPWFGPPMAPLSFATARLMETWAHALDIRDTLGVPMSVGDRLRHIAHLGVRTRSFSFQINGMSPPEDDLRVELTGPDGQSWCWGAPTARHRLVGPALDFCLLVTQRRHRDELALTATGDVAERWLAVAQAFAGPPGPGRKPAGAPSHGDRGGPRGADR